MPALTPGGLAEAVVEDGTFDASQEQALRWLNERQRLMVARARNFRKTLSIPGGVVYGQSSYLLPPGILEILQITVGGIVYGNARHNDYAEGERGWVWLGGEGGIAGRDDDSAGAQYVRLFPVPAQGSTGLQPEEGAAISLYVAAQAPTLTIDNEGTVVVPDEYLSGLISGAIATGLLRVENRPDLAKPHEELFDAACQELLRATNRRFRGTGPAQVRVKGINA